MYEYPISFAQASSHITDPNYGLGVVHLWQLPPNWRGTRTAKIHDLRYDYLMPGECTQKIDLEAYDGWVAEGVPFAERQLFYGIIRAWGMIFKEGVHMCKLLGYHNWMACSYGQNNITFDYRCSVCGEHTMDWKK